MKVGKHKRNFFKKLPIIILSAVASFIFFVGIYFISQKILDRAYFLSPLAQNKTYKINSLEGLLQKNNILFDKIQTATDSSHIIFLKDDGQAILSSRKDIQSQVTSLQVILSRLTIEGKKFKRLDLRFDKPIIEF